MILDFRHLRTRMKTDMTITMIMRMRMMTMAMAMTTNMKVISMKVKSTYMENVQIKVAVENSIAI